MELSTRYEVALPGWLVDEVGSPPPALRIAEDRVALVNRLADRNWREGSGGPFAAIVVDRADGSLVAVGVNVVLSTGKSSQHAEVTTLGMAQEALRAWDLGAGRDLELVVNWRPCAMCFGAVIWSGVRSLLIAGSGPECEALTGFDEGPMVDDWVEQLEARGIAVRQGVRRDEAITVSARTAPPASGRTTPRAERCRGGLSRRR